MKCKCGNNLFYIQHIPCCDDCSENGAWDEVESGYTWDEKVIEEKDLERNQVDEEGECAFDLAFGLGCKMFICSECRNRSNLPFANEC